MILPAWSLLATSVLPYPAVDCDYVLVLRFDVGWLSALLSTYDMKEQLSSDAICTGETDTGRRRREMF